MSLFGGQDVTGNRGPKRIRRVGWIFIAVSPGGRRLRIYPTTTGSLSYSDNNSPRVTLTGLAFLPRSLHVFNPNQDKLQVYLTLDAQDYLMGTYYATSLSRQKDCFYDPDSGSQDAEELISDLVHIDFADGFVKLQQSTESPITALKGSDPADIMRKAAEKAGFNTAVGASNARLGNDITWDGFTSLYEIIDSMYETAGHRPPWIDFGGNFRSVQAQSISSEKIDLFELNPVASSIVISENFLSAPNRVVVFDDQAGYPLVGVWNAPSAAPHSFANRGYYITQSEPQQGLADIAAAQKAAEAIGEQLTARELNCEILPTGRLDGPKILEYDNSLWLLRDWSVNTDNGAVMTIGATELIEND